jgi:hypothetical protein
MIEVARIDCASPTHKAAHMEPKLLVRDCCVWFDLAPVWPGVLYSPQEPGPPAAAGTIELPDPFKML